MFIWNSLSRVKFSTQWIFYKLLFTIYIIYIPNYRHVVVLLDHAYCLGLKFPSLPPVVVQPSLKSNQIRFYLWRRQRQGIATEDRPGQPAPGCLWPWESSPWLDWAQARQTLELSNTALWATFGFYLINRGLGKKDVSKYIYFRGMVKSK